MTREWGERARMRNGDWALNHITNNEGGIESMVDSPDQSDNLGVVRTDGVSRRKT